MALITSWSGLLDTLEVLPDIREWVLQRYIDKPLLLSGHKFHLRVYILCVGALRVYTFDQILLLLAAHTYDLSNTDDIYSHLTNTARNAELSDFDEEKYIKVSDVFVYVQLSMMNFCTHVLLIPALITFIIIIKL